MRARITLLGLTVIIVASLVAPAPAQEGTAEQIGRQIEQGLEQLAEKAQRAWAEARKTLDQLSVQGRVYARLRWDKAFAAQPLSVEVAENNVITLTGQVPNEAARKKAITLAQDTVGVRQVVDRLRIVPRREGERPAVDR